MDEQSIFLTALEKAHHERSAWLDVVCANDTKLRQRIEALLRTHEGAGSFLEHPPPGVEFEPTEVASGSGDRDRSAVPRDEDRTGVEDSVRRQWNFAQGGVRLALAMSIRIPGSRS